MVLIVVGLNVLLVVYTIDLILSGSILLVLILGPLLLTLIYWAGLAAYTPLSLATQENASQRQRSVGLLLIPVGLTLGFLMWQAENWFIYGVLDADPRLYNWVFQRMGLGL